jgi:hypothetical protein
MAIQKPIASNPLIQLKRATMRSIGSFGFPVFLTVLILVLSLAASGCSSDSGLLPWNNSMTAGLFPSHMRGDIDTRIGQEQQRLAESHQRYLQSIENQRRWFAQKWAETEQMPEPKRTYMRQKLLAMHQEWIDDLERTQQEMERQGQTDAVNDLTDAINDLTSQLQTR